MKVDPKKKVAADFSIDDAAVSALVEHESRSNSAAGESLGAAISHRMRLDPDGCGRAFDGAFDLRIAYGEAVDKQAEIARLKKEIERLAKDIESKKARLADETFLSKAPAKIVEDLKATLAGREIEYQKLLERLEAA